MTQRCLSRLWSPLWHRAVGTSPLGRSSRRSRGKAKSTKLRFFHASNLCKHCTQKRLYNRLCVMSYACVSAVVTVCPKLFSVGFCTLLCVAVPLLVKTWEGSWQRLVNSCLSDKSLSPILDHFCWHFSLDIALAFSYFPAKYAAEPQNLRIFISNPIPPAPSPSLLQKTSNKTFLKAQGIEIPK